MKNVHWLLLAAAATALAGCARDDQTASNRTGRTWTCSALPAPGGDTLSCTSSALIIDESTTGGDSEPCSGIADNPDLCPAAGGVWSAPDAQYLCTAGSVNCPPTNATPGANLGTDYGSGDSPAGSATGGGAGGSGEKDEESGDGKASDKGDKADKADEDKGSGGSSDGKADDVAKGSSAGTEQYECRTKRGKTECVRSPNGAGGSSSSTSGGTSDGVLAGGGSGTTTSNGKEVTFDGSKDNGDGTSTWCWSVKEVSGQDLSNWVIGTGRCQVVSRSPSAGSESVNPDPNSGLVGVKWNTGAGFSTGQFCVTFQGTPSAGAIKFSTKAPGVSYGMTQGPICQ